MTGTIIVGAGHAGVQAAASLREDGYSRPITVLDAQDTTPYQRPPLSKEYLMREGEARALPLRPASFYERQGIALRTGIAGTAVALDRVRRVVSLATGEELPYEFVVIAVGARNRPLSVEGIDRVSTYELRTIADAEALRARFASMRTLAVVGGGFIGLELAAAARTAAVEVTVIEATDRLMARVVTPVTSEFFADLHRGRGVRFRFNVTVEEVVSQESGDLSLRLDDGSWVSAETVAVGIGALPRTEIVEAAGLAVDGGIIVDGQLRTGDPRVFAVGDCAIVRRPGTRGLRLESVQNAVAHGRMVSRSICGAKPVAEEVPWFWTTQFDARLQIAGLLAGHDHVEVRGEPSDGTFVTLGFNEGRLLGGESVNSPRDHLAIRRLLGSGEAIGPHDLSELGVQLGRCAPSPTEQATPQDHRQTAV